MNVDDEEEEVFNKHDEILLESCQEIVNKTNDESHELSVIKRIENIVSDHLQKLNLLTDTVAKPVEKETVDHELKNILLNLKSCRSMEDLCIAGGFSMYRGQQKVICDLYDDASDNVTKKSVSSVMILKKLELI